MKFSKRLMACGLAVVMASTCSGASDVALAAKKPSISKKSVTITAGKKKTIKVKNASKTVKWSSNKKKVVTVKGSGKKKATGTLKGVSKGTATVTAKVGSKKLTCKVTVKKASSSMQSVATNIQSISVDPLDTQCIVLTMKKKTELNVQDISVGIKDYKEGSYNMYPSIKTIATSDQVTYRIYLNKYIANGSWAKVTLSGKDSIEKQYKRDIVAYNVERLYEKGEVVNIKASEYFDNYLGEVTYSVSGNLPSGLTLNTKRGIIKGIPTTAGEYPVTIKATDELGRSQTASVIYKIYDDKTIMVENKSTGVRLNDYVDAVKADNKFVDSIDYYDSIDIVPQGGSGTYKFEIVSSDTNNARLNVTTLTSSGTLDKQSASQAELQIPYSIAEGTHTYTISIEDAQDPNRKQTMTVKVTATKYYNVSGSVKDIFNTDLNGNKLYFYPVSATSADSFESKVTYGAKEEGASVIDTDKYYNYTAKVGTEDNTTMGVGKGTYTTELAPGEYIVKIQSDADAIRYQMDAHVVVSATEPQLQAVVAPIRFYTVTAYAKYKNGSVIPNEKVYFEMKEEQYESNVKDFEEDAVDMKFSVDTAKDGSFKASLPANTYVAYLLDEDGQRHYFTSDVTVEKADLQLQDFNADLERYAVGGKLSVASGTLKKQTVRIYDAVTGEYRTTVTDDDGNFQLGLPGNATYVVKAQIDGIWHKFGTTTVSTADMTGTNYTYSIATEFTNADVIQAAQVGQATTHSVKEAAVSAKFVCEKSGSYSIVASAGGTERDRMLLYVFDEDGNVVGERAENTKGNVKEVEVSNASMTAGKTYYIMLLPEFNSAKKDDYYPVAVSGTYTLTVK